MKTVPLYRFTRPDGGVSVSPVRPDTEYTQLVRLVAEEGRTLTDGITVCECVDTNNPEAWEEILTDSEALAIIMGGNA